MSIIMINLSKEEYIISFNDDNEYIKLGTISKEKKEYCYKAQILENNFSIELNNLINEYWKCVDSFSISLADYIESEIKKYNLIFKNSKVKIFDIEIKNGYVTFFIKYPTSSGFLNDYPINK
jgi:hypothetical protein